MGNTATVHRVPTGKQMNTGKTVSVTGNICAVNRVVTVFCFMVQGMTVGITGNDCWYNRGPTGKQMNTGKNCFSYREYVCSVAPSVLQSCIVFFYHSNLAN